MSLNWIKRKLWQWPDGLVWVMTEKQTIESRRQKFKLFMFLMIPKFDDKILDIGVASHSLRGANFLELWYPFPGNITALSNEAPAKFKNYNTHSPLVKLVFGDGRNLGFRENQFDIVFSNAVVEHVGGQEEQKQFIHELVRVGKKAFVTTPNYHFPIDFHTLIPFVHLLPRRITYWIYKKLGREYWADMNHLNLLTSKRFISLFPYGVKVKLYKQRIFGIISNLIAVVEKK
jgi:SAM-dependent methyltransferase